MLSPFSAPISDAETSNRALVPIFDLTQNRLQIIGDSFFTFSGVLNLNGDRGHRVSEVNLGARRDSAVTEDTTEFVETVRRERGIKIKRSFTLPELGSALDLASEE
jgi:hypothetical protein